MKKKLSIIIPVYNAEKYIKKCIKSCYRQDMPEDEYEVIVINDGSTDETLDIVETLTYEYSNLKIFSKKNEGLGQARNDGIELSRGEYIWFVDADDWIEDNCISSLYSVSSTFDLDLLWFKLQRYNEEGGEKIEIKEISRSNNYSILEGALFLDEVMGYSVYAVLFFIKRAFLIQSNLRFVSGIYYEDAEFIPRMVLNAKRVKYEPITAYNYLYRKGSIIQSVNEKKINDLIIVITLLNKSLNALNKKNGYEFYSNLLTNIVLNTYKLASNPIYKNKQSELIENLKINKISKIRYNGNISKKLQIAILNISPKMYLKFCEFARYLRNRNNLFL